MKSAKAIFGMFTIVAAGFVSIAATDSYPHIRRDYYEYGTDIGFLDRRTGYTIYYCDDTNETFGFVTGEIDDVLLNPCP